ncbi:hypothetical protein C1645_813930 [Glomus cerebriforme]|uniref:Uncharacterized protein n=1 Tax=Glomus cerebriforme TaxID=658196 RepID=A0A397TH02_9GLOM|nr:hypothetical protein C1645_813930 [Glomus cerebriforme]
MELRKITWLAHCDARSAWEKSINITQRTKRSTKLRSSHRRPRTDSSLVNQAQVSVREPNNFSSSLWLIWASSNFLHSGSWSHHRSITLQYGPNIDFIFFINSFSVITICHPLLYCDRFFSIFSVS